MIVIADTTPLNYLVLIDRADLLPQLFGLVLIPPAVFNELKQPETSELVRDWVANPPSWLFEAPQLFVPAGSYSFRSLLPRHQARPAGVGRHIQVKV